MDKKDEERKGKIGIQYWLMIIILLVCIAFVVNIMVA